MQGCKTPSPEPIQLEDIPPIVEIETPPPVRTETIPLIRPVATTTPYTVKSGDTISGIAARYGLRWQDVIAVNPGIMPNRIQIGQVIQLPGQVDTSKVAASHTPPKAPTPAPTRAETVYVVKSGDSISEIALAHGVKTEDIRKANDLKDVNKISIGQKLTIPGATKSVANVGEVRPTPPRGDAPVKQVEEKEKPVIDPVPVKTDVIEDAAELEPAGGAADTAPISTREKYTVKEGDDLYSIAIRWGVSPSDLRAANKLPSTEVRPGMVLEIPGGAQ